MARICHACDISTTALFFWRTRVDRLTRLSFCDRALPLLRVRAVIAKANDQKEEAATRLQKRPQNAARMITRCGLSVYGSALEPRATGPRRTGRER
jgi:hypothetical protein